MILRRRSLALLSLAALPACATRTRPARPEPMPAEALTNERTIRLRCEDPEGVIAGRVLCVLKDLPRARPSP
jgi:hypothetical protein